MRKGTAYLFAPVKKISRNIHNLITLIIILICFWAHISAAEKVNATFTDRFPVTLRDTVSPDSTLPEVTIKRSWPLPEALQRISGFDFIDATTIACVQDAAGAIYIYNLKTRKIVKEIPFAPPGDYQAICIVGTTAFVACADGRIVEISRFMSAKPQMREYGTHLTSKQNAKGICFDKKGNRLLVSIEGEEEGSPAYKGIYAFDLKTKKMPVSPAIRINLNDSVVNPANSRKFQQLIQPSDISIRSGTGRLFICDATKSQLVVVDNTGNIKTIAAFPRKEIIQPEGIRFGPSGELFVVSGGSKDEPGKLLLIEMPLN